MKRLVIKLFVVISIVLPTAFIGIGPENAWAERNAATSMFVSPMSQKMLLTPGEVYEGTIQVSNSNMAKSELHYELSIGAYSVTKSNDSEDDYGDVDITARNSMNIMMDWISFESDNGIVEPNASVEVPFYISVPSDAPAGAQYATILVTDIGNSNLQEGDLDIGTKLQIASVLFANVAGETTKKGAIENNYIPAFLTASPLKATSMARNDGNIYTDAEYVLQVWPLFSDEEICTNEETPETSLVLPGTERYHVQYCDLPPVGIFRAKQTVEIFGEISTLEKTIIVCPLWLMFLVIFAITAIIIYFVMRAKSRKRRVE